MAKNQGSYDSPLGATLKGITDLFKKKERIPPLEEEDHLQGKTVLITGSSSGLGLATAIKLAKRKARIIMAVRSGIPDKGELVMKESGSDLVDMEFVNLSDFESINSFLESLSREEIKIDVLICNAAIVPLQSRKTAQGLEEMFMVNYMSTFYLVNRILKMNLLTPFEGSFPRIVIVSSESHRNSPDFDWDSFGKYQEFTMKDTVKNYGYYKLLLTTFANELSRRLKGRALVRALCPGPVNSNIAREAPGWMQPLLKVTFSAFFRSPEKACEPVEYFAAHRDEQKPIDYLFLMSKVPMDDKATDAENGRRLWKESMALLADLDYPIELPHNS